MLLDLLQIMVYLLGVCFHQLGVMIFFCCSLFGFSIDDIMRLSPAEIYQHFSSFISCHLIRTTLVLMELISVSDDAFCLNQFDDDLVRSLTAYI